METFTVNGTRYAYQNGALCIVHDDALEQLSDDALEALATSGEWAQMNAQAATWRLVDGEE